jgi:hypothetical protein
MYELEHPGHLEEARRETEEALTRQLERVRRRNDEDNEGFEKPEKESSEDKPEES